jgi:hypothetical protein
LYVGVYFLVVVIWPAFVAPLATVSKERIARNRAREPRQQTKENKASFVPSFYFLLTDHDPLLPFGEPLST